MSKILMAVTIDTECDKSPDWTNSNPISFNSVTDAIPNILQPLFHDFSIKPTYFLSPEVIEDTLSTHVLSNIKKECELGTHLHADFIEPSKSFDNYSGMSAHAFQTDYSSEIEFQKLTNLTNNFYKAFNFYPKVFRAGRYAASSNTIRSLIKLNYKVDSSFTPHLAWKSPLGSLIDHQGAPEQPYFCNANDIYSSSESLLLEVPITIIKSKKYLFFNKKIWLRPKFSSINQIKKIIEYVKAKYYQNDYIVLTMMFHSQELVPNASPYTKSIADVENYIEFLKKIFQICQKENVEFLTLEEIYNYFR